MGRGGARGAPAWPWTFSAKLLGAMLCAAVITGAMIVKFAGGIALMAPVLLGGLALIALVKGTINWPDEPSATARVLRWTMVAFASRLAFGLVVEGVPRFRGYLGPDANYYNAGAAALARHWSGGYPMLPLPHGKEGFFYLLAALYWVFGPHAAAGVAVNAAMSAALVPLLSDTTRRLFGRAEAKYVPPLVVLIPGLLLWTSQLLREAAAVFLIAVAINSAIRLAQRLSLAPLTCFAVALTLLFTVRGSLALEVAMASLVGVILGGKQLLHGISAGALTLAIVAAVILTFGVGYAGYHAAVNTNLATANDLRQGLATTASSGFGANVDISTPARALSYLPIGLATFIAGPFPWQLRGLRQLPALPQDIVWWYLLPSLWRGLRGAWRRIGRGILPLALPTMATTAILALTIGNFGALERERTQVVVMVIPLIALGLAERKQRRQQKTPREPVAVLA